MPALSQDIHCISCIFCFSHYIHPSKWVLVTMATGFVLSAYRLSDFLQGLIDFTEAGELPTQQLSLFVKTSAHLTRRFQWMFICCVVGEMMQWHQRGERLHDSCHFEYRERIQFESQRDIVFGAQRVRFDALTSAERDCGAQMTLQTLMPSSVTP